MIIIASYYSVQVNIFLIFFIVNCGWHPACPSSKLRCRWVTLKNIEGCHLPQIAGDVKNILFWALATTIFFNQSWRTETEDDWSVSSECQWSPTIPEKKPGPDPPSQLGWSSHLFLLLLFFLIFILARSIFILPYSFIFLSFSLFASVSSLFPPFLLLQCKWSVIFFLVFVSSTKPAPQF